MSTTVDTNVLVDLLVGHAAAAEAAAAVLDSAYRQGALLLCPVVYAELMAYPGRSRSDVDELLSLAGMQVDWHLPRSVWADAGEAFGRYADRRRREGASGPRRLLADFLIGAHAQTVGALITRDLGLYRVAFPDLRLIDPSNP